MAARHYDHRQCTTVAHRHRYHLSPYRKIHRVKVGYRPDTRWKETREKKKRQKHRLREALARAGCTHVVEHVVVVGRSACVYHPAHATLEQLGLAGAQALKLMHKLRLHAIASLRHTLKARHSIEHLSHNSTTTRRAPPLGMA